MFQWNSTTQGTDFPWREPFHHWHVPNDRKTQDYWGRQGPEKPGTPSLSIGGGSRNIYETIIYLKGTLQDKAHTVDKRQLWDYVIFGKEIRDGVWSCRSPENLRSILYLLLPRPLCSSGGRPSSEISKPRRGERLWGPLTRPVHHRPSWCLFRGYGTKFRQPPENPYCLWVRFFFFPKLLPQLEVGAKSRLNGLKWNLSLFELFYRISIKSIYL